MQYLQAVPTLVAVLLLAFLGFLVIHNQYKRVNLFFLFFVIVDALWLASVYTINFTVLNTNAILGRVVFAFSIGLVIGAFSFIDSLLHFYRGHVVKRILYVYSVLLFGVTLLTPLIIRDVGFDAHARFSASYPVYGALYLLFPIYLVFAITAIFTPLLGRSVLRKNHGTVTAQQLAFVRWGIIIFALLSLTTNLLLPIFFGHSWPPLFTPIGSILLASSFFYAIGRYKLFDVRFVVLRAAAYLTTVFVVTFVFITPFVYVINRLLGQSISITQFALIVLFSVVLLYLLQYFRRFFDKFTASVFFRNYYDIQDVLDDLSGTLVRTADLKSLQENTANVLKSALKPDFLRYLLAAEVTKPDSEIVRQLAEYSQATKLDTIDVVEIDVRRQALIRLLRSQNIAVAIRLHTTHEDLGFLIAGFKRSGDAYDTRDKRLLSIAADEIAISLQNMLRFEQIQRFNVTLQDEVDNATRKLRRTNRRLEELDDIKDDFISMASHQLRTPLTSVKGYLSMVLEGDAGTLNEMQGQMLKQAFTSSQRMVFLITDLLNVSRLKTGKFVIDAAPANLDEIIKQELEQLHDVVQAKGVELSYDRPASFPMLMLDDVKIRQVIMNFVDNAIYYTPPGGHIQVELTEKNATVEVRVIDDGIGVPKSEQHHLFTKFYRATNARRARPDGTGLGLFMAQKVIVAEGGSVIFSSQEGKGSIFGFSLPKNKLAIPEAKPSEKSPAKAPVAAK